MDCLFCSIVNKSIPADIIYEDSKVIAFNDISPQSPTHFLIIPKQHIATINDLDEGNHSILGHMALTAKKIAANSGFADDGFRLVMNCNNDGGQTVYHIHMHVLAGRQLQWPPG